MMHNKLSTQETEQRFQQIRELLFGEAMRHIQGDIQQLDKQAQDINHALQAFQAQEAQHLADLQQQLQKSTTQLQTKLSTRIQALETQIQADNQQQQQQIDALKQQVNTEVEQLKTHFEQEVQQLRKQTNGILQALLKKLDTQEQALARLDAGKVDRDDLANSFGKMVARLSSDLNKM